jgi:5-formyltetrahydrofolate cyclo-ligase
MTDRKLIRRELIEKRNALSAAQRMHAAESVAQHLLSSNFIQQHSGYIAGYWAVRGELPLHVLQMRLPKHWIWCLPIVLPEGELRFAPWKAGDPLVSNAFGIPEPDLAPHSWLMPEEMHAVLLPLTGFDSDGNRLGTGGGYYDRSFAFRQRQAAPPKLIGAAYARQEVSSIPHEDWDVRLDAVLTEQGLREFAIMPS